MKLWIFKAAEKQWKETDMLRIAQRINLKVIITASILQDPEGGGWTDKKKQPDLLMMAE